MDVHVDVNVDANHSEDGDDGDLNLNQNLNQNLNLNLNCNSKDGEGGEGVEKKFLLKPSGRKFYVYGLVTSDRPSHTYIGATVDLQHRWKQHNGLLKGGAILTSKQVQLGRQWTPFAVVHGFPSWQAALQFEWRWKQLSRLVRHGHGKSSLEKRLSALRHLLSLDRSTSKAIPFFDWPAPGIFVRYEAPFDQSMEDGSTD